MAFQTVFKRYELKYMLTLEQKEKLLASNLRQCQICRAEKKYEKVVYKRRLPLCESDAVAWACREETCPFDTQGGHNKWMQYLRAFLMLS